MLRMRSRHKRLRPRTDLQLFIPRPNPPVVGRSSPPEAPGHTGSRRPVCGPPTLNPDLRRLVLDLIRFDGQVASVVDHAA